MIVPLLPPSPCHTVPMRCVLPESTFYTKLLIQTIGPLVPITLLWGRHVAHKLGGTKQKQKESSHFAAKYSLLWLELVLTSVSTTIVSTFSCSQFDRGALFLSEQLSLPCNNSRRRTAWVLYAWLAVLAYPLGSCNLSARCFTLARL